MCKILIYKYIKINRCSWSDGVIVQNKTAHFKIFQPIKCSRFKIKNKTTFKVALTATALCCSWML